MTARGVGIALLALVAPWAPGQAQRDARLDSLADRVRAGSAQFRDRRVAIQAGYRRVGPDFPGMAEHWVNIPLLMQGTVDPSAPPILSYVTVDGTHTLVGVAFAVPVEPGAAVPPPPAHCGEWHFHAGTVEDESFLPDHAMAFGSSRVGLAVLHAWVWLANPEGLCARDNWALPYARAGLTPPVDPDPDAARALSLVSGAREYYRARWHRVLAAWPPVEVDRLVDVASEAVRHVLRRSETAIERDRRLAEIWRMIRQATTDEGSG